MSSLSRIEVIVVPPVKPSLVAIEMVIMRKNRWL